MTALSHGADIMSTAPNAHPMSMVARTDVSNPSTEDWVNVFGPNGYNVQPDNTRHRKLGRVHLPDVLKVRRVGNLLILTLFPPIKIIRGVCVCKGGD